MSHGTGPAPPEVSRGKLIALLVLFVIFLVVFTAGPDSWLFDATAWVLGALLFVGLVFGVVWVIAWAVRGSLR
jgi:hypothetical protein